LSYKYFSKAGLNIFDVPEYPYVNDEVLLDFDLQNVVIKAIELKQEASENHDDRKQRNF